MTGPHLAWLMGALLVGCLIGIAGMITLQTWVFDGREGPLDFGRRFNRIEALIAILAVVQVVSIVLLIMARSLDLQLLQSNHELVMRVLRG